MPKTIQDKPSKTIQSIRMLKILKSKEFVTKKEIASLLGESTLRNINNYKNALYDAGYQIEYKPGINGGYYLVHDQLLPSSNINRDQVEALSQVYIYVLEDKNFINRQVFLDFVSNILSSNDSVKNSNNHYLFGHFPLSMSDSDIQKRYYILQTAIDSHRKVKIKYKGYHSDIERVIHPLKLFKFQNWHVYAVDTRESKQGKNTYTQFKLHRILKIELLEESFVEEVGFDVNEHFTDRGLVTDTPFYVKLRIYGPMGRTIDEKVYGKNQKVYLDNKSRQTYNFEATMYDRFVVLKFVLSLGEHCKVIEPQWLKREVVHNAHKIIEYYKRDNL